MERSRWGSQKALFQLNSSQDTQACGSAWTQTRAQPMLGMTTVKACWKQSQEPFVESESLAITRRENNKARLPATLTAVVICT